MPGNPYAGIQLAETLERAAILSDVSAEAGTAEPRYKKGMASDGVKIYHLGLRRGITCGLRVMIRRCNAIEPGIGHMKTDGKLDRNWLKGVLAMRCTGVLCGAWPQPANDPQKAAISYALMRTL